MEWPVHAKIDGPIVMIGFGSIGRGTLPLIERHFTFDKARFVVVDPREDGTKILANHGIRHVHKSITRDNYRAILTQLLTAGGGTGGADSGDRGPRRDDRGGARNRGPRRHR